MNHIVISNNFHNTSTVVRPHGVYEMVVVTGNWEGSTVLQFPLTPSQRRRADRKLCGVKDCACGGVLRSNAADVQEHHDGGVTVSIRQEDVA
jgi:hypothetical protein